MYICVFFCRYMYGGFGVYRFRNLELLIIEVLEVEVLGIWVMFDMDVGN